MRDILLVIIDVCELIILFFMLFVLTIIFKVVIDDIRYLFLIGDIIVIGLFSKTINNFEKHLLQ